MLGLIADGIRAGRDALRAEAERLKRRAALSASIYYVLGLGVAFAMAGVTVVLEPVLGLGWSLLAVAGFLILIGVIGMVAIKSRG